MRILGVCDRRYEEATRKVVGEGAAIITSPPAYADTFHAVWLAGRDLIYVDLHGQPGSAYLWSGPGQEYPALAARTVKMARLGGAIVFAATCYLPQTPFIGAFLQAGASAVVGGDGPNYGTRARLSGAQHLARYLRRRLEAGEGLEVAFVKARRRLMRNVTAWLLEPRETRDTLRFRIWRRGTIS